MRKYKGKHIYTITAKDVIKPVNWSDMKERMYPVSPTKLFDTMGALLPCDIGKQVYEMPGGHYQVENDEQLRARL